ncbi:type II membrane protein [Coniosporium apollinis]|uniref:Autophagy-related protein 27 n=1 Tax=Coniosporium apollinis TaxID=61459 RepID=A0ABQ9P429_9PEZI|nr:type II membrane protein [Coniosporium apollinis]
MPAPRLPRTLSALLALTSLVSAVTLDCADIVVDKQRFDLSPLKGPHSVHWLDDSSPSITSNYTFTIDICAPLQRTKGVDKEEECPHGTRVCGIERDGDGPKIVRVIPIAGNYEHDYGRPLDPKITRLKDSDSHADASKEGLRIELHGGKWPFEEKGNKGHQQRALVEFICDAERDGLEGDEPDKREKEEQAEALERRDEDDKKKKDKSLKVISYKFEGDNKVGVLRMEWRTRYACEKAGSAVPAKSTGWGFFTWFIIILFLAVASYLIFGSWLNYNRYGARGWDLLPHGDTIRDIPYLLKDWARSIMSTIQGGGSRGGYSAV